VRKPYLQNHLLCADADDLAPVSVNLRSVADNVRKEAAKVSTNSRPLRRANDYEPLQLSA
jgi:hypothetical protein